MYDQLTDCKDSLFWKCFSYVVADTASVATFVTLLHLYNM